MPPCLIDAAAFYWSDMIRTTDKQRIDFWKMMLEPLEDCPPYVYMGIEIMLQTGDSIDWILDWIEENFDPHDIFSDERLSE